MLGVLYEVKKKESLIWGYICLSVNWYQQANRFADFREIHKTCRINMTFVDIGSALLYVWS